MPLYLVVFGLLLAALGSLLFSTLTYALRELSRSKLAHQLERFGKQRWMDKTIDRLGDLIFVTAVIRLFCNLALVVLILRLIHETNVAYATQLILAAILGLLVSLFTSVMIPHALAKYSGELIISVCIEILHGLRFLFWPIALLMHWTDTKIRNASGANGEPEPQHIEQEILSVVEEGEKEGIVDKQERSMIESVIEFRDTTVGQIMSARTEIVGIEHTATLEQIKQLLEESGHSRVPIYQGSLDHIIGVLYARDLLKHLGLPSDQFDIRSAMRPAFYVPESKPLRDLLQDFRLQKVHMAIVLDEYGGTAGLVTIEDILEELVGEISDEHEPKTQAAIKKISDHVWEADARVYLDELNRVLGLALPEDAGYDTLGGYLINTVGRIPENGESFEINNTRFTVLEAEPQKVNRLKIEMTPQTVAEESAPKP